MLHRCGLVTLLVVLLLLQAAQAAPSFRDRLARVPGRQAGGGGDFMLKRGLVYTTIGERQLKLDLYIPRDADGTNPVALYIHGGGWTRGSRRMGGVICRPLAQRGYVTASLDYRLADEAGWPAQIHDCQAAVRWLQAHAAEHGGDATQLVVTGGSAGGQLALSLACGWGEPWPDSPIRACCSWYGPTDLALLGTAPKVSRNLQQYLGATRAERALNGKAASPLLHVDAADPPVLFIHGTDDPLVPIAQSQRMHAALQEAGVSTELIAVQGGKHGALLAPPEEMERLVQRMLDFFDARLGHG